MKSLFRYLLSGFFLCCGLAVSADPVIKKSASATAPARKKMTKTRKPMLYTGADYNVASQKRSALNYTRSFSKQGKFRYLTTYNLYDKSGTAVRNIVAVHDKKNKTVEVTIKDMEHSGFPVMNVERTGYSAPFMGRFGSTGKVGAMANAHTSSAPGQLTVKFVSRKFDYIKVVHVAGPHEDSRKNLQVFVLDEK